MTDRRTFNRLALGAAVAAVARPAIGAERLPPVTMERGGYTQGWFLESFLEFADDVAESHAAGKRFAILWEQDGCPYCRETHMVNFGIPEIRGYVKANFNIVQLDIWGARNVVDFDGEQMTEKALAKRARVRHTPTIQFFPESPDDVVGKTIADAEIARMPGYFRPFHFLTMFEFVREKAYADGNLRSYLGQKLARMKAEGRSLPAW